MAKPHVTRLEKARQRIGEAALNPGIWPGVMEEICGAIRAMGAILLQSDLRTPDVPYTESLRDMAKAYFQDGWYRHDLRARGIRRLLGGATVYTDQDIVSPEEMRKHPYYNEFMVPCGGGWFAGVGFRSGPALWVLALQRSARQGPFNDEEVRLLSELSPYLTESATLSNAVGRITVLASIRALGAVLQPAVALDHFGLVLETNPAMESLLDEHICVRDKRLWLSDAQARSELEKLSERITGLNDGALLVANEPIIVRRLGRPVVTIRALAVPPVARSPFLGARVILTFTLLEPKPQPAAALLARSFGLTPAEARLAAMIACGTSLETAAEGAGITRETARSQLKAVFAKTCTHRQSELVALLARL